MNDTDLNVEIELLRRKLIATGMCKGLTAPETVGLSQELDQLLNIQRSPKKELKKGA